MPCHCLHFYHKQFSPCVTLSTWRHLNSKCWMKSDHIEGNLSFAQVRIIPHTLCTVLCMSSCIGLSLTESMVFSDHKVFQWNHSAPRSTSHHFTKSEVDCWMSGDCCRLALKESQPWQLYLATLVHYILCCCPHALSNPSLATCCLSLPSSSPPEHQFHIASNLLIPHSMNPLGIVKNFPTQAIFKSFQKLYICRPPVPGSISKLFHSDLSWNNGLMLVLQKPSNPLILPLVECTNVGQPCHIPKLQ